MKCKILSILAVVALAGCGASYSPDGDLPEVSGSAVTPTSPVGVCATCASDADCGPGSFCIGEGDTTQTFCTAPCASDGSCDEGQSCVSLLDANNNPTGSGCFPSNGSCLNPPVVTSTTSGTTGGSSNTGSSTTGSTTTGSSTTGSTTTGSTTTAGSSTAGSSTTSTSTTTGSGTTTSGSTTTGSSTTGSSTTGSACTQDTWSSWGQGFFATNCTSCHRSGGDSPNLTSHSTVQSHASLIKSEVDSHSMPEGGSLSSSDITRLDTYLDCGAP